MPVRFYGVSGAGLLSVVLAQVTRHDEIRGIFRLRLITVDAGTSQHRMARHDQSRLACVGWRSCDLPTAIAPRHPIRVARLGSWLKARAKSSARAQRARAEEGRKAPNTPTILGGWASRDFTEVPTWRPASTEVELSEPDGAPDLIGSYGRRTSNTNRIRQVEKTTTKMCNSSSSNTNHVPFASFRIDWTSGASAPECH